MNTTPEMKELGRAIATLRGAKDWTQEQLGEAMSKQIGRPKPFHRAAVAAWEGGANLIGRAHLSILLDVCGAAPEERAHCERLATAAALARAA